MPTPPAPPSLVDTVLAAHGGRREQLLQVLREVQAGFGWLSRETLAQVARGLGLTPAIVEGVASFYRFLHLQPVGQVHWLFSDNVTDRQQGSRELAQALCQRLGVSPGQVRGDGAVSIGFTSCTGLGDQGPAALINQHQVLTRLTLARVHEAADLIDAGIPPTLWPKHWQLVSDHVYRRDRLLDAAPLQGRALRAVLASGPEAVLTMLEASGLRGRGGAGFPMARKWRLARASPVPEGGTRCVVCNADEGEPGTFKDRVLLSQQADEVFEGMTVAARLLDARRGFLYLRGEYRFMLGALQAVLARRRAGGLLGRRILGEEGFDFDIEIHLGAGAYVCGEESALIESLEGKRGNPRIRPPFPVERGYLGQPTVVNNVETLCAAAWITAHGEAAWRQAGTPQSTGTKLHAISGDVARPGVYEWPLGTPLREMLAAAGAVLPQPDAALTDQQAPGTGLQAVKAVQVGGPSGVCLSAAELDRRVAFEDVPSAGALMVFDQRRDMFEVARGFAQFFAEESCGFCTPCRVGTELIVRRMDKLAEGFGSVFDEQELRALQAVLQGTTHCGLGATAANPLRDTLQRFPADYARRLVQPRFVPAFDLDAELEPARRATGRQDAGAHLQRTE
jgi:[NiFe] hydrogenase diaphorase moiety large subunit